MIEPYENQIIGAFIYAFGYTAATRDVNSGKTGRIMPVNLLQQTPLDTAFGDLIVGSDRGLVIEFKRSERELLSERSKWSDGEFLKKVKRKELINLSIRTHFIVYGSRIESQLNMQFCSYMDALVELRPYPLNRGSGQNLIELILRNFDAVEPRLGASPPELLKYLEFLSNTRKKQASQGGRKIANGAWVGVAEKNGRLLLQAAPSLECLLSLELDHTLEKDRELDRGLDRGVDR